MKTYSPLLLYAIMALIIPLSSFADTPTVSGLTARQRYPWNGLVDISFTLSGIASGCIAVTATNTATGAAVPVRTLRDKAGNAIGKYTEFSPGKVSLVWDAGADMPETLIETLSLSVVGNPLPNKIQLWAGGPYWAETNVGAEEPYEYGLFFWWGDTIGYRREGDAWGASDNSSQNFSFDSENTPTYNKSKAILQSEGWITADNVLTPEHDAAHIHWGGSWRLPTREELSALNDNCDWTWTTMNGVNGYVVQGRDDYASASIFLPAAGFGERTSLEFSGPFGAVWSAIPDEGNSRYAWYLFFRSDDHGTYYGSRADGFPVRPVQGFAQ